MMNYLQQRFSNQSKQQLASLKGYLIFLTVSGALANFLVFEGALLTVACFFLFSLRLIKTKQLMLTLSCLVVFILSLVCFKTNLINQELIQKNVREEVLFTQVRIDPNTIQVDGDSVRMEGLDLQTNASYALSYRVKEHQEQLFYQEVTSYLQLTGSLDLQRPQEQRNLNGFDYRQFLKEKKIYLIGDIKSVESIEKVSAKQPIELIKVFRRKAAVHIDKSFDTQTVSNMKSLLFGIKDAEFKNQQGQLGKLGILHFFSISGMHLFFFIGTFRYLLLRGGVTRESAFYLELIFLFIFLFMTGFSTSVGRSVLFISLLAINKRYKWHFSELDCWSVTLAVGLVLNPYLLFQAAGQLSFGLTFYIIYLKPIVAKFRSTKGAAILFSCCLSIFAIPIISYQFNEWHLLSLILTFLLLPLFSLVLLPTLSVSFALSLFFPLTGWRQILEIFFTRFQGGLSSLNQLPVGHIVTGKIPILIYLGCLALTLVWLANPRFKKRTRVLILLALLVIPSTTKYTNPNGLAAFVDVGQGDCFLLQLPFNGEAILVDTGGRVDFEVSGWQKRQRDSSIASQTLLPLLKSRGISTLSHVFITHGHEDHFGDLLELSREVTIKQIIYPIGTEGQPAFKQMIRQFKNSKTEVKTILSGESWQMGDISLQSLYPDRPGTGGNDDSLALRIGIKDQSILLTGDLEQAGEAAMVALYPSFQTAILSAGHHGSRTSSNEAFLAKVQPEVVVISAGLNNRFGHPHEEALARLAVHTSDVYRTDQHGMVYFEWTSWKPELSKAKHVK